MRGGDEAQDSMWVLVSPEKRVPLSHPLRAIKSECETILKAMNATFSSMYSSYGRKSIPPERLLKSTLLMALFTIRSERQFCEQLNYNMLFRWFLNMHLDEPSFDHSTFSHNRKRLLKHHVADEFFYRVTHAARLSNLTSDDHFSADGTLIDAWASMKSFRPKDSVEKNDSHDDDPKNPSVDFRGETRKNSTHISTTDPEAKLAKKSQGAQARLSYSAHALMENRNGFLMDFRIESATGTAEREMALQMLDDVAAGTKRITLGGDKNFDTHDFVKECRARNVTPHVAQNKNRRGGSAIDNRTAKSEGYKLSLKKRKLIEEIFGWIKTVGNFRKTRYVGKEKTQSNAYFIGAAYNLLRMAHLKMRAA